MKKTSKGRSFFWVLTKMNMLPLILLALIITIFGAGRFASSMTLEAKNGLVNLYHTLVTLYDTAYEGSYYTVSEKDTVYLMKGEHLLNDDFTIIDSIKENTGIDITIFYQDTRLITTIQTNDGIRAIGTKANDTVVKDVLEGRSPHFYFGMMVEGVRYFSYYEPLYASDGTCIGMIFLGRPSAEVEHLVYTSLSPLIVVSILTLIIVCPITMRFSRKFIGAIQKIQLFLETISKGELHTEFDADILKRKDELGDMGRYLIRMQKSLQELVERDILTGLYNRRSGEYLLRQIYENHKNEGTPFCIVIGDIDHFKRVNDTYGHECGDMVLTKISSLIKEHMQGRGFAARWGGEEILLVYQNMPLKTAISCLKELMEKIRGNSFVYGESRLSVTMTFGLVEGNNGKIEHIIRDADIKLYEGKNNGRNKIVYEA